MVAVAARPLVAVALLVSLPLLPSLSPSSAAAAPRAECVRPPAEAEKVAAFLAAGCHLDWPRDLAKIRATGPTLPKSPHGKVRVWYSPEIVEWLKKGRPEGGIPDGAMMFKEMYSWSKEELSGGAYMLMRRGTSFDGWYWGGYNAKRKSAWGAWGNGGCLNCHASADNAGLTFAALEHIDPKSLSKMVAASSAEERAADAEARAPSRSTHVDPPARKSHRILPRRAALTTPMPDPNPAFTRFYPVAFKTSAPERYALPPEGNADEYVSAARGPDTFLTSSNCSTCHRADAPLVMADRAPSDLASGPGWYLDLSPFGEWDRSLMGLAGRDPVFHAQLELQKILRLGDEALLDETCYRCHGVMGLRQAELDGKGPFRHSMLAARSGDNGKYGTLALDGISCSVCHHIAEKGLGSDAVETGRFEVGPADRVYGPYSDNVKDKPMRQALGITPAGAPHVQRSSLCGTCHAVRLPILKQGQSLGGVTARTPAGHEQATYLEWRNSGYQDEVKPTTMDARTCQGCHMPGAKGSAQDVPLRTRIANIEEYLPTIPNSLPRRDINLTRRTPYSRHTLVGLNYAVLEMFNQAGELLGVPRPPAPDEDDPEKMVAGIDLTRYETARLARTATARLAVSGAPRRLPGSPKSNANGQWEVTLEVTNLAGHKLPSGVGFRRAFLTVELLDAAGRALWGSGRTDELGVIVDEAGRPLGSELTSAPAEAQPHHALIDRADQVQIYEERVVDDRGRLTVDFLGQYRRVKDNRLLPRGWRTLRQAPGTAELQPVGVGDDPAYLDGRGGDEVTYRIPALPGGASIRATLHYQSLPPYYLKTLFEAGGGRESERLYYIASRLDLSRSAMPGWKLPIATTSAPLPGP